MPRLPPIVPALRIWGDPTVRAAWASALGPRSSMRLQVTPLQMAGAYGAFANHGRYVDPHLIAAPGSAALAVRGGLRVIEQRRE